MTQEIRPVGKVDFCSPVDIIIPFYGQYEKTERLITSILQLTTSSWYNLCLVDDCSKNSSFIRALSKTQRKRNQAPITCIRNTEQKGFGGALEVGYNATKYPWVVFMNSDCEVVNTNWLKNLGNCMLNHKSSGVKMVAAKSNNCVNGDSKMQADKPEVTQNEVFEAQPDIILGEEDDYLSFYCVMCHRDLFKKTGGFIKNYPYGYFEDEEFAWRMKRYGYKQAIAGNSWVYHEGDATIKALWNRNARAKKTMLEENRQRCLNDIKNFVK